MHFKKESIPETTEFGNMAPAYHQFPQGIDVDALLEGLPNNLCHCPHWGYVEKGSMIVRYADGSEEEVTAGDMYYLPPNHTVVIKEDIAMVEFSPNKEYWEVMSHIARKMQEPA
jgi:hypothetical protein